MKLHVRLISPTQGQKLLPYLQTQRTGYSGSPEWQVKLQNTINAFVSREIRSLQGQAEDTQGCGWGHSGLWLRGHWIPKGKGKAVCAILCSLQDLWALGPSSPQEICQWHVWGPLQLRQPWPTAFLLFLLLRDFTPRAVLYWINPYTIWGTPWLQNRWTDCREGRMLHFLKQPQNAIGKLSSLFSLKMSIVTLCIMRVNRFYHETSRAAHKQFIPNPGLTFKCTFPSSGQSVTAHLQWVGITFRFVLCTQDHWGPFLPCTWVLSHPTQQQELCPKIPLHVYYEMNTFCVY